jgi:hypothetical protein
MSLPSASVLFFIIALIYAFFVTRDFYKNKKKLTLRAKIWLLVVLIFLLVSLLV